jgi:hypothetical protein
VPTFPLSRKDGSNLTVLLVLVALLAWSFHEITRLRGAIAARPKVEARSETKEEKRKEEGRVVIVKKYLPAPPGSCPDAKPQLLEERIERDPVVTTTAKESESERKEAPAPLPAKNRFVGVLFSADAPTKFNGLRGGLTLLGTFDAAASVRVVNEKPSIGGDLNFRF